MLNKAKLPRPRTWPKPGQGRGGEHKDEAEIKAEGQLFKSEVKIQIKGRTKKVSITLSAKSFLVLTRPKHKNRREADAKCLRPRSKSRPWFEVKTDAETKILTSGPLDLEDLLSLL